MFTNTVKSILLKIFIISENINVSKNISYVLFQVDIKHI